MDSTELQDDQPGTVTVELAPLGPVFITANDAATWAHHQVSDQRGRVYGGVIVKRADNRYQPTVPIAGDARGFDFGTMLNTDAKGDFIHPQGYSVYAFYSSRTDQSKVQKDELAHWTPSQLQLDSSFFSMKGLVFIIEQRAFCPIYYLSGLHDSLIKYESTGSKTEADFLRVLKISRPPTDFENFIFLINSAARAGVLRVVVPNGVWGGKAGQVVEPWTISQTVEKVAQERQTPPHTQVFRHVKDAIRSALPPLDPSLQDMSLQGTYFGYLLIDDEREYVAHLPEAALKHVFALRHPKLTLPKGRPKLPSGFYLHGIYCSLLPATPPIVTKQTWLADCFFTASSLATAFAMVADDEQGMDFYLRANDGALLVYHCTGSPEQLRLVADQGRAADERLKAGTLTPAEFVREVAAVGTLTVLETGQVWDKAGIVGQDWRPYARILDSLSPVFVTADDAARYQHYASQQEDEYLLSFILQRSDGRFLASRLLRVAQQHAIWGVPPETGAYLTRVELEGHHIVALFERPSVAVARYYGDFDQRTARQKAFLASVPYVAAIFPVIHFSALTQALYTSGMKGTLIKYQTSGSAAEREFEQYLWDGRHGAIVPRPQGFDGTPEGMVKELLKVGELTVLLTDESWYNVQGRVPATWAPQTPFKASAPIDTPLSLVFTDLPTALQYAHDRMQAAPGGRRIGCILKHRSTSEYVVTEPADAVQSGDDPDFFALSRLFPAGSDGVPRLPSGFVLKGWYCRSEPDSSGIHAEPWLYESFIATLDFARAIAFARRHTDSNLALYFSTLDGAQLGYQFSGSAQEGQLFGVLPDGRVTDNGLADELRAGTLTPHALILKVAEAGALSVLQPATLWDTPGLVRDTWRPYASVQQPLLSSGFLQMEDAARYAHGQLKDQRERDYTGYILQRSDGLYVATEPLYVDDTGRFALGVVYPQDAKGRSLLPTGHTLKAVYGSCRGVSLIEPARMAREGWSREDAYLQAQFFSADDIYTLIQNRHQVPVGYLSSARDALLVYDMVDLPAQASLLKDVTPSALGSPVARNLDNGSLTAKEWVRQVAAAGSLRVVLPSPLWGASGLITEHWRPSRTISQRQRPEQVSFGAVFAKAQDAAQALHRQVAGYEAPTQTGYAFILKHRDKDAFVCTEVSPSWDKAGLFAQGGLFQTGGEGGFAYPANYQLHGLFYVRHWVPQGLVTHEHWLARHFLSAEDLDSAVLEARRLRETGALTGLPIFISTLDRALLRVQAPVSSTLFKPARQESGVFEDEKTLLAGGQMSPVAFINQVARLSWLSVVVPSDCWGRPGKLEVSQSSPWAAYGDFLRRPLSPLFSTQADAVRYVYQQPHSAGHGGLVLGRNGKFVATQAVPVSGEDFNPKEILPDDDVSQMLLAPGWKAVARYRCRGAAVLPFWLAEQENQVYQNLFATPVLGTLFKSAHLWTHEYLFGPDGSLLCFTLQDPDRDLMSRAQRDETTQLLEQLETSLQANHQAPHDPFGNALEQQLRAGRRQPSELVNQLVRVGTLTVLEGSPLWGTARKVLPGWMPGLAYLRPDEVQHAVADRALSPVFKHADDAARHGHEATHERGKLSVGVILKSSDNGHFVASSPVKGDDLKFNLDRVFISANLPLGYALHGLYVRLPTHASARLPQGVGYEQLIAPAAMLAALSFLRVLNAPDEQFLPLYLSCPDGALVRYQATRLDSDFTSAARQEAYLTSLHSNGTVDGYVLKLAQSGELRLLASSPFWVARARSLSASLPTLGELDPRLALGPLCAHPDDAARLVWQRFAPLARQARQGAILSNGDSDTFIAVQPVEDPGPSVPVGRRRDTPAYKALFEGVMNLGYTSTSTRYPKGYKVIGVQQLYKVDAQRRRLADRYEDALARNFVTQSEIRGAVEMLRQDGVAGGRYYFTPLHGGLIVFEPSYHADENQLLRDDWEEDGGTLKVLPSEVIRRLATSGKLTILEVDRFWLPRSQVARHLLQTLKEDDPAE
ncbi:hypothetical protein RGV33_02930 [Pseudomonas sp. Bout1]|uniref:hypothetical protein n=1 Tax=Pseudomonas sp. Bout1 TaxID=3048600 RepID=UPI002AB4202D|nr:hypothetical protein [Pseudomonas sp. Bout1]MDY7530641.1 hypothetical protein [Pseudomonas sp. Bout1]MEB0185495.1 hypothetical protein [Pseudomonas sp. Bout1]